MVSGRPETKHVLFIQQARENPETEICADRYNSQFENKCFTEMCSGSEVGSNLRPIDFLYHSTQDLREISKKRVYLSDEAGGRGAGYLLDEVDALDRTTRTSWELLFLP